MAFQQNASLVSCRYVGALALLNEISHFTPHEHELEFFFTTTRLSLRLVTSCFLGNYFNFLCALGASLIELPKQLNCRLNKFDFIELQG